MKKTFYLNLLSIVYCLFISLIAPAQGNQSLPEKKVDFLERIYFSGKNKSDLNTAILIALQEIESMTPTDALAKQTAFLIGIRSAAENAEDACEILEMISSGIYSIDAAEAVSQGVIQPSDKAKVKSFYAIQSISKINNTANGVSGSATNLGWSMYALGSAGFGKDVFKVANTSAKIGKVGESIQEGAKTLSQAKDILASTNIFKKKDKACKAVPVKEIAIGLHQDVAATKQVSLVVVPDATATPVIQTTIISIPHISNLMLRTISDSIKTLTAVQSVVKSYDEALSTITITQTGTTDFIADWLQDHFGTKLKLTRYITENGTGKISLASL